jgi:hypothetical protein
VSLKSVPQFPPDVRRLYRAENDPAALRIELAPAGIAAPPDVAIVVVDDEKLGDEREASVRIIMSPAAGQHLDIKRVGCEPGEFTCTMAKSRARNARRT